ncbi:hypothetical protein [Dyella japonica]|uniref:hypothetical protein n=1 Tax=Dyella japonica TaxID=231455 RepID=UPI001186A7CA|nr:hypothetical protein [Dyella japonica]
MDLIKKLPEISEHSYFAIASQNGLKRVRFSHHRHNKHESFQSSIAEALEQAKPVDRLLSVPIEEIAKRIEGVNLRWTLSLQTPEQAW